MTRVLAWVGMVIVGATASGCLGSAGLDRRGSAPPDPILGMLDTGIRQLTMNLDGVGRRITALQRLPKPEDPALEELRILDLTSSQLHRQQWSLYRDHLVFAKEQLQQATAAPGEKGALRARWIEHERDFLAAMDDLRGQRQELEMKRLQVQDRLIQRRLQ